MMVIETEMQEVWTRGARPGVWTSAQRVFEISELRRRGLYNLRLYISGSRLPIRSPKSKIRNISKSTEGGQ